MGKQSLRRTGRPSDAQRTLGPKEAYVHVGSSKHNLFRRPLPVKFPIPNTSFFCNLFFRLHQHYDLIWAWAGRLLIRALGKNI